MSRKTNDRKSSKLKAEELNKAVNELDNIRNDLSHAYTRFDDVTDPHVMEACIYEISALKSKYDCAIRNVKSFFL